MAIIKDSQKSLNIYLASSINDGHFQRAREHIKEGANVNHNGGELLIQNIMKSNSEAVSFLIDNKASFKTTHQKLTPILTALKYSNRKMVELLIEKGANAQENNNAPIENASHNNDFEMVKYLHQNGASLNDKYDHILRDASEHSLEALKYCIENGAKANNPAYVVSYCAEDGKSECLVYLANKGFDLNAKQDDGEYPLLMAAMAGRADNIEILLKNRVEPNDQKALLGAINNGHLEATKILIEHGADPTANNDNALYQAISWGHNEIIDYLIAEHKMPVSKETREWLANDDSEHVGVIHIKKLLEKRDLFEKLTEKAQRPPQTQQKKQVLKL